MNKKANFSISFLMTIFVLLLVVMALGMSQQGADISTIDKTIETLNWTKIGSNVSASIQRSIDGTDNELTKSILGICNKAVDFMGYSIFEVAKLAMNVAKEHPDLINYKVLFALIILSLIAPSIYPVFIIIVSIILIIKEALLNRRERKALEKILIDKNSRLVAKRSRKE